MRRSWLTRLLGLAVAVCAVAVGWLAFSEYNAQARVEGPGPTRWHTDRPVVRLHVTNADRLRDVRVFIDGLDLSRFARVDAGGVVLRGLPMRDGWHRVRVRSRVDGWFGESVDRRFGLLVDTRKPPLELAGANGFRTSAAVSGTTERGARVTLSWPGGRVATVARRGSFVLDPDLPDGMHQLRISARDAIGNRTVRWRRVVVDSQPPSVDASAIAAVARTADPTLKVRIDDRSPLRLTARFDGDSARLQRPAGSNGVYRLPLRDLPEGLHTLSLEVVDPAGNSSSLVRRFTVDSTEKLSSQLVLIRGARGADVESLQQRLDREGFWDGGYGRVYDTRTVKAVKRFQRDRALLEDGIAGPAVIAATTGRLVVHLSQFRVYFLRAGNVIFSAPIATGTARYPTPLGRWAITSKIRNPTWNPPNSPWAAGLEAIPPGSDNPLGSRWIGTSAPNVGFHATNSPRSVGRAASHGCMRMYQADVEALFDLVAVGMPVEILP